MNIIVKTPEEFDDVQLQDFESFVLAGGEVSAIGLSQRIHDAEFLVMLYLDSCLAGIGAVKNPSLSYRRSVSDKAKILLDPTTFPYEIGWIFVLPSARRRGISRTIVDAAITSVKGMGIFSTSRTNNIPMHRSLEHFGFIRKGQVYTSNRGKHQLQLFTLTLDTSTSIAYNL